MREKSDITQFFRSSGTNIEKRKSPSESHADSSTSKPTKKKRLQRGTEIISSDDDFEVVEQRKLSDSNSLSELSESVQKTKKEQPLISKFFTSSTRPSSASTHYGKESSAASDSHISNSQVSVPKKKFARSDKTLVKKKPREDTAKDEKFTGVTSKVVEFDDDDDDFDVPDQALSQQIPSRKSAEIFNLIPEKVSHLPEIVPKVEKPKSPTKASVIKRSPVKPLPIKHKTPTKLQELETDTPDLAVNESASASIDPPAKKSFFQSRINRGGPIAPGSKPLPVGQPNCLSGLSFVFTGELDSTARDDAVDLVKRYGARVVSAPSSKTDYVVVGREAGESKLKKIEQLKLKTLDEDGLFSLIEELPGKESLIPKVPASVKKVSSSASNVPKSAREIHPTTKSFGKGSDVLPKLKANVINDLWTVKYAPQTLSDIIGNKSHMDTLTRWLCSWKQPHLNPTKSSGKKDDLGSFRAALLSGPPGIGKTTAAHLISKQCGFEVIELNASDARNKASLDNTVKGLISNHSIGEYFKSKHDVDYRSGRPEIRNHVIVMDEVDGMAGGDRGGMAELIQLIKKTKVPIIAICNDRQSPKVRSLANHCLDIRFARPMAQMIRNRVVQISQLEGMSLEPNAIDQLVQSTQSDIRQILTLLQTWNLKNSNMNFDESKGLSSSSKKNVDMGPFDLAGRLFSGSLFRGMTMEDKLGLYFSDYQLLPPFVQENYIRMKPWVKQGLSPHEAECSSLESISNAAEMISNADTIESMIYKRQEFSLMPVHAMFSCIIPATSVQGNMGERLQFPSILGQVSKCNKSWRLLKDLQVHMRLHTSGDKLEIRQSYMPALIPRLCIPLIKEGTSAIETVINYMDEYYITREDWDSLLELSLGPWSSDIVMKKIPSNVKSAFTKTYNKSSHQTPFSIASNSFAKGSKASSLESSKVDLEEAMDQDEVEDEDEVVDDEGVSADKMIKAKAEKKITKSSLSKTSSTSSSKGSRKKK